MPAEMPADYRWESASVWCCSCGRANTNCNATCLNCGRAWPPGKPTKEFHVNTAPILPERIAERIEMILYEHANNAGLPAHLTWILRQKLTVLCAELRGKKTEKPTDSAETVTIILRKNSPTFLDELSAIGEFIKDALCRKG